MTTTNTSEDTNTNAALVRHSNGNLPAQKAKVDAPTIDAVCSAYPEAVRDAVAWLAGWYREQCKQNRDVLVQRVRSACGVDRSWNYFYQVFTGRYFMTKQGEEPPAGQIAKFLELVEKLRAQDRFYTTAGKIQFVETNTYRRIASYIDSRRMAEAICKFGVIIGYTGLQKSASFRHYTMLNNHGATIHIEAPDRPRLNLLIDDLATAYGAHLRDRTSKKIQIITEAVSKDRTIIIDNAQRLRRPETGYDQPVFSFLQKLQDDTDCTIILSLTPITAKFLTDTVGVERWYFEQFEGRAGGRETFLVLDDWTPKEDLLQIAAAFGIDRAELRASENIKFLTKLSRQPGRIRIYFDTLQRAKRLAVADNKRLTVSDVMDLRPDLLKQPDPAN